MIIKSYHHLRAQLEKLGCQHPNCGEWFFRGLSNDNFKLIPSLYYSPQPLFPQTFEKKILSKFVNKGIPKSHLNSNPKRNIWVNAFLARHYGLRSRMIDWTIDLSVGLYFMRGGNNFTGNAVLYIMSSGFIGMENSDLFHNHSYFDFNSTLVLNPSFDMADMEIIGSRNRFIQNGKFLIQGYKNAGMDFYESNKNRISKITIPRVHLENIYIECCADFKVNPNISLMIENDPNYEFCETLNNEIKGMGYILW
jgi:hypothetical protein